jgi:hypothetical protein
MFHLENTFLSNKDTMLRTTTTQVGREEMVSDPSQLKRQPNGPKEGKVIFSPNRGSNEMDGFEETTSFLCNGFISVDSNIKNSMGCKKKSELRSFLSLYLLEFGWIYNGLYKFT